MTVIRQSLSALRAAAVALSMAMVLAATAQAQDAPRRTGLDAAPTSAIYIGNSFFYFNNGVINDVGRLLAAAEAPAVRGFRQSMVTISGSGFDWHDVDSYFRPNGIGKYSFDAGNNVVFNKIDRLFDVALLMDCSQCPIHPQLKPVFHEYAKRHADTVRRHGTTPAFFMSWAYKDKPEMTALLAAEYTKAGNDNDVLVIPAGLAFARSIAQRPELELYAPDKRHPSPAGTYLSACVIYASLFGRSPMGLAHTGGLDAGVAAHLQKVAAETVAAYYRR